MVNRVANGLIARGLKKGEKVSLLSLSSISAVAFRDDFPRNALGKVLKKLLREPYWKGA